MGFKIQKGINLSHWLSQERTWAKKETFVTEKDIQFIKEKGFDHVRLPIDEEVIWDTNRNFIKPNLECIINCIEWCEKHGLKIIVDLHILRSHHFNAVNGEGEITLWDKQEEQENLINLWLQLSEKISHFSTDFVAYEFMNEPVAPEHEQWNELLAKGIKALRELEPERVILMGSNMWQKTWTYPFFKIPKNDPNFILSFHMYEPILVSHYKAYWMPAEKYEGPIQYPGVTIKDEWIKEHVATDDKKIIDSIEEHNGDYTIERLEKMIDPVLEKAKEYNLPIICSEFGCLPSVERDIRIKYMDEMVKMFQRNNIAYTLWDFKGDFGVMEFDRENDIVTGIDEDMIAVMTQ